MITVDEYLGYCDRALDAYAAIVTGLGDDLVNARLDGIPGSNSAFALVAHISGMTARWGSTVNRGIVVPRDRPAEFTATGTVDEALALLDAPGPVSTRTPARHPRASSPRTRRRRRTARSRTRPRARCCCTSTRSSPSTSASSR